MVRSETTVTVVSLTGDKGLDFELRINLDSVIGYITFLEDDSLTEQMVIQQTTSGSESDKAEIAKSEDGSSLSIMVNNPKSTGGTRKTPVLFLLGFFSLASFFLLSPASSRQAALFAVAVTAFLSVGYVYAASLDARVDYVVKISPGLKL